MDFNLSWSIIISDGLYWGIASSFVLIVWIISIFSTRSRDWLIDLLTYTSMIFFSSCRLGCIALHWGISIFWRDIILILDVGASDELYGDHWIISCCPHCILGHSHLIGCFDIETWLSVCDYCFRWIMELLTLWVQSSRHTWMISDIDIPFISY